MAIALLNTCFDPRLNHDALRAQFRQRLQGIDVPRDRLFVTTDAGGNLGSGARNLIAFARQQHDTVVAAGVLHHDDCLAATAGLRQPLEASLKALEAELARAGFQCPIFSGSIVTESSTVVWPDLPPKQYEVMPFRMPRMYGR